MNCAAMVIEIFMGRGYSFATEKDRVGVTAQPPKSPR